MIDFYLTKVRNPANPCYLRSTMFELPPCSRRVPNSTQWVLDVFKNHPGQHLAASDVHRLLKKQRKILSEATIYRAINKLEVMESIYCRPSTSRERLFEYISQETKNHIFCIGCSTSFPLDSSKVEQLLPELVPNAHVLASGHELVVYVNCHGADCSATDKTRG
ncbi:transcriptional repressor [Rouxiella silvae]|uniref:Transcriptional repressor n=1 Tax=Rouxiella silvae TaxID=1646373 RepID=A0AA41BWQ6_9GAMM|nr:transcriptional repressor [Rouxiella silvae]MBF6637242.1 transcriptional repressor [Rouxiella silvae]